MTLLLKLNLKKYQHPINEVPMPTASEVVSWLDSKIVNMIDQDKADEIDLAFAALNKRVKRTLNEEELEDLMDKINQIATCHIKASRSKK